MKNITTSPRKRSSSNAPVAPSHEEIMARAEALWREKGCPQGCDDEIWLEAEQQLFCQRHLKPDQRDVISTANPRFEFDQKSDEKIREFDERFSAPAGKETTSL
jgi:hypothetical protein